MDIVLTGDDRLLSRWVSAAERLGAQHDIRIEGERLLAAYRKPHRRYHDITHLHAVLDRVDQLEIYARDADVVRIAAWFHDAVYAVDRSDNETASALLAEYVLDRLDIEEDVVAEVSRLVRMTATHDPGPGDRDGHVLSDADLGVLGGSNMEYVEYAAAVRLEYAHVTDADFADGRTFILKELLDRPQIYRTPKARATWEEIARRNIRNELRFLASDDAVPQR